MKITEEQFNKLYSEDISKKEYEQIIALIDARFQEIVNLVFPFIRYGRNWYVYANVNYDSEGSIGRFDINDYKQEICIGGENKFPEPYCNTDEGNGYFPTRWLWTDNDEIVKEFNRETEKSKNDALKEKERAKQKQEDLKNRKAEFRKIIESKLTKEELKYIQFK
jgi:hypothetical protein